MTQAILRGKRALVTGSVQGIGLAMAKELARAGAELVLHGLPNPELHDAAIREVQAVGGLPVSSLTHNLADPEQVARMMDAVLAAGPLDILVNNAGISARSKIDDPEAPEVWDRLLKVNLDGLFNVTHALVPALKSTKGCIVNLSSIVAFVSGISSVGYVASKGAVRSLTQALARDLAPHGVRVNAVAPGLMLTEMVKPQLDVPGGTDWFMKRAPMARGGLPEEVVGPIVFLASGMASYVNGVVLPVDGGFLAA